MNNLQDKYNYEYPLYTTSTSLMTIDEIKQKFGEVEVEKFKELQKQQSKLGMGIYEQMKNNGKVARYTRGKVNPINPKEMLDAWDEFYNRKKLEKEKILYEVVDGVCHISLNPNYNDLSEEIETACKDNYYTGLKHTPDEVWGYTIQPKPQLRIQSTMSSSNYADYFIFGT